MLYMLLIAENEKAAEGKSKEELEAELARWFEYDGALGQSGKKLAGHALQPALTATTVRKQGDQTLTIDGPFAESKEQLGGYYVIDARDLDDAIYWASRMPHLGGGGSVEIRPIMMFDQ